jgi:glucans biosynthesis protein
MAFCAQPALSFSFSDVSAQARKLADEAYQEPKNELPPALRELDYDQYRDIRFRPTRSLWRKSELPFEVQFFHPGFIFTEPVRINLVGSKEVTRLKFDPDDFLYGDNKLDIGQLRELKGFAGFRVHYPVNRADHKDEVAVFLGASYFRALGKDQLYGLSARGLAIDTGEMSGEEFPRFTEFWLEWPDDDAKELVIYALLDSRRMTGAYRFVLKPGVDTVMDVQARLYFRDDVGKLGIAPLTSMYFFGENQRSDSQDYRPEVHDSDGLLIETGTGEWIWRPLVNPRRLLITSFALRNPRGFGLMQRDRDFVNYQDLEARYERRPSTWITPVGKWGPGRIELVQIPTSDETNDNVVAYWIPDKLPEGKKPLDLRYTLNWQWTNLRKPPFSVVTQTRRGRDYRNQDDVVHFIVDFEGSSLKRLAQNAKLDAVVWVGDTGELLEKNFYRNEITGGQRISLRVRKKGEEPVEMRAALRQGEKQLSETWSYILP